ncbi:MAG: hypothetical protein LBL92_06045, partial [Propionibacteriaceae bacterium]|nr:hypothetical protein [Propionibacteriaceae bacterium]
MRQLITVVTATGLTVALAAGLFLSQPLAFGADAAPLGSPVPGSLSQIGGPAGWAEANADALSDRGLDPAAAGQVNSAANSAFTTSLAGDEATIAQTGSDWRAGAAVGDATGEVTLRATAAEVGFSETHSFFTRSDLIGLMPKLTFSFATYTRGTNNLQYWGHYALDLSSSQVTPDDKSMLSPPNSHPRLSVSNSSRLDVSMVGNTTLTSTVKESLSTFLDPGVARLNQNTQRIYQGYAEAYAEQASINLGTASLPYSFGTDLSDLAVGDDVSVNLADVVQSSWLDDLSGQTEQVPVSFSQFDWRDAMAPSVVEAVAGSAVEQAFNNAFDETFGYQNLVNLIAGRTDAEVAGDIEDMLTEFLDGLTSDVDAWGAKRIEEIGGFPTWYGILRMDKLSGQTTFTDSKQQALTMYPNLVSDTSKKIVKIVKDRVKGSWYNLAANNMTGTATVVSEFTPGTIEHLQLTAVEAAAPATTASPS